MKNSVFKYDDEIMKTKETTYNSKRYVLIT